MDDGRYGDDAQPDVLIFATGFKSLEFLAPRRLRSGSAAARFRRSRDFGYGHLKVRTRRP